MSKFVPNSFQITNAFVDEAMNKLSDASVKIYLLIVRKTRGWGKDSDSLSLSQLEELSGKSRPTVVKCLNELVKVGLVKKHPPSIYGNVYSLIDNYNIGERIKFPGKKFLLVKEFSFTNTSYPRVLVKNFNHPENSRNQVSPETPNSGEIRLKCPSKKSLLVKNFNLTSKNILPLLVKNFYTQKTLSKKTNQNKKKSWLVLKKLKDQIASANDSIPVEKITEAKWFKRELEAFENFNADRNHNPDFKIYLFADWLLKAYFKYEKQATSQLKPEGRVQVPQNASKGLSDKQRYFFACKLSRLPEFAKYSNGNESYEQLAKRLESMLKEPANLKKWAEYLINISNERKGDVA